jgi:hypothetical protein
MTQRNRLVVLDIDATLLHTYYPDQLNPKRYHYLLNLVKKDLYLEKNNLISHTNRRFYHICKSNLNVVIVLRKGLREFLKQLNTKYDIALWSAGSATYVKLVEEVIYSDVEKSPCVFTWDINHTKQEYCSFNGTVLNYSKPVDLITAKYPHYTISNIVLFDNRVENADVYNNNFVQAPHYEPDFVNENNIDDDYLFFCFEFILSFS